LIVDSDLAAKRVIGHHLKHETRFENENSEDALTWNVFRSLQRARRLHEIARLITGQEFDDEPRLYLWGLSLSVI
jgi:DNA repair ATPase RecN